MVLLPVGLGLVALAVAGALLVLSPALGPWSLGRQLAVFHLTVIAGLLPVVLGAMTQLASATTGHPYTPRQARLQAVGPCLVFAGGLALAGGFWMSLGPGMAVGGGLTVVGLALGLPAPVSRAWGVRPPTPLHIGIAAAGIAFTAAALVGTWMALGLTGVLPLTPGLPLVHVALAVVLGFCLLLQGVSWQLASMFAQAPYPPRPQAHAFLAGMVAVGLGAIAWPGGKGALLWGFGLLLGLFAVSLTRRILAGRAFDFRPTRVGSLLWAWHLAAGALALAASPAARTVVPAIVLGVFGGVLLAVFTYLDRIVPFVVWNGVRRRTARGFPLPRLADILPGRGFWVALAAFESGVLATAVLGRFFTPLLGAGMVLFALRLLGAILRSRRVMARMAGTAR